MSTGTIAGGPPGASASAPAPEPKTKSDFATAHRTHTCGELTRAHRGLEVTLCGAVDRHVDDRTYEIRDAHGKTLVRRPPGVGDEDLGAWGLKKPTLETIVKVKGKVEGRKQADPASPTGEVEVVATAFEPLSSASEPLLFDPKDDKVPRAERIRHRYLYLRKPAVHKTFAFRTKLVHEARRFLVGRQFTEVETPILANKWTPEAHEFYLAIRDRVEVFALPGHRPIHGTVLMASGFDRVFEVARRFRRKDVYGPWQQPEFSVLDVNAAFVDETDLHALEDALLQHLWREVLGVEDLTVETLTYDEALVKYGTDCPDARYALEIQDVTGPASVSLVPDIRELYEAGGSLRAIRVPCGVERVKERELDEVRALLAGRGPKAGLIWISVGDDGAFQDSGTIRSDRIVAREIVSRTKAEPGDMVVVALESDLVAASALACDVRERLAHQLGLIDPTRKALVRVTRLPYCRYDPTHGWGLTGDLLSRPVTEELDGDPFQLHAYAHVLALNGVNVGGGSIRNHARHVQNKLFEIYELAPEEIDKRFGQILAVLQYGVPPHGRIALGVDRLAALALGLSSIDEVIPMPKADDGLDPLTRSPWPIQTSHVRGLLGL
jgi:aspartyl-tRNA synthetase